MYPGKAIISVIITLVLIIFVGVYATSALDKSSKRLESHLQQIEDSAKNDDWEKAQAGLLNVKQDWSKSEKVWAALLDHIEIDNIDTSMSRMVEYINLKEKPLTIGETATLKQYIKHIPQKESFNLKNIF